MSLTNEEKISIIAEVLAKQQAAQKETDKALFVVELAKQLENKSVDEKLLELATIKQNLEAEVLLAAKPDIQP